MVTKRIEKIHDNLESANGPNLTKLKQKTLQSGKVGVLTRLDEQILEMFEEEVRLSRQT